MKLVSALLSAALAVTVMSSAVQAVDSKPVPTNVAVPKVYVIPMEGQLGTDIAKDVYDDIVKDVQKVKPDIIIYKLKAADAKIFSWADVEEPEKAIGASLLSEYRELIRMLRNDLRDYPQIMWVEDAVGWGSLLALSFPDMYFAPDAKLVGVTEMTMKFKTLPDEHVAAKLTAAFTAMINGFLETGGYQLELGNALMLPDRLLSASWKGRSVYWRNDTEGQWVIDSSEKAPAGFSAASAEDTGLSDGTADNIDDLVYLLGYREYSKLESGQKIFEDYKAAWRREYERTKDALDELQRGNDNNDPAKAIGHDILLMEKVVAAMRRFTAVERRLGSEGVQPKTYWDIQIEMAREKLQGLRNAEKARNRTGRNGAGGAPGGAGPGNGGPRK